VGDGTVGQLLQPGDLLGVGGDDELAAGLDGDPALAGVGGHRAGAGGGHGRLETAGGVVQAGVDDAGVAAGLVPGEAVLLVQDGHLVAPGGQPCGDGEPDDPGPHDDDVAHLTVLSGGSGRPRACLRG
jgi:hypothetical protein